MNKRYLLIGGLLALGLTASACGLAACTPPEEQVPVITERIRYTEENNPYAELTWQEYADINDWAAMQTSAPVYYQFEGSYSEAYQGNYSRDYLYMNCYEDGSVHGTVRNTANSNRIENYYGYWTNINARGKESLVLNILSYNGGEYNQGMYEIVCDTITGGYYDFQSNIAISKWGNQRTMSISGYRYSPVTSLDITTSAASAGCIIGDEMNYSGLVVRVNRENGKSIAIDEESYRDPTCRVKFSGFSSEEAGDKEVTVSYVNTEVTATYTVKVMGVKSIALDASEVVKSYKVGESIDTTGLIVTATREDDVETVISVDKCTVTCTGAVGDATPVTVEFQGLTATYDVAISAITFTGTVDEKEASIKWVSTSECEFTLDGTKYDLEYSRMVFNGTTFCTLIKPKGSAIDDATWNAMNKQYSLDLEESTITGKAFIYEIPDDEGQAPGTLRYDNEPSGGIGGGTEQRFIIIDEGAGTATLTYKYWYAGQTDTFVCRYTIEGGVLTLTEEVSHQTGYGGQSFNTIHKVWSLQDNFTALRNPPRT